MADASEIDKVLTAAWIRTGVPSKIATEAAEFYRSVYGELSIREIVAAAAQEEADCIVMAKRKLVILVRYFARSVSELVSANASCPVLSLCPPQMEQFSSYSMHRSLAGIANIECAARKLVSRYQVPRDAQGTRLN